MKPFLQTIYCIILYYTILYIILYNIIYYIIQYYIIKLYSPKHGIYFDLALVFMPLNPLSFPTYSLQSEREKCTPFNLHENLESKNHNFFHF